MLLTNFLPDHCCGKDKHVLDSELTNKLVKEAFAEIPRISLVPGFISRDMYIPDPWFYS